MGVGGGPVPAGGVSGEDVAVVVGAGAEVVPELQADSTRNNVNTAAPARSPFGFLCPTLIASNPSCTKSLWLKGPSYTVTVESPEKSPLLGPQVTLTLASYQLRDLVTPWIRGR